MVQISHSKPWVTEDDKKAVTRVLATNMLAQGEVAGQLEHRLSAWVHAIGGVAVGSGSAALVLALRGVGVRQDDEVVLPTYVCQSVLDAVIAVGGIPVLCDVGEDWVVTPDCVAPRLTEKTKAIIVPHMYGVFANVEAFRGFRISVIEDCAQAVDHEASRKLAADVAIFSFHPTKCLTSGEGGMAVSAEAGIVARMRALRDGSSPVDGRLFSPLSDISAGLALSQLQRYAQALARRAQLARRYAEALESSRPESLNRGAMKNSMFFRFPIHVQGGLEAFQGAFLREGIHVRRGVDSLLHRSLGLPDSDFPVSVEHFQSTLSLPIYPALTAEEERHCLECAAAILSHRPVQYS